MITKEVLEKYIWAERLMGAFVLELILLTALKTADINIPWWISVVILSLTLLAVGASCSTTATQRKIFEAWRALGQPLKNLPTSDIERGALRAWAKAKLIELASQTTEMFELRDRYVRMYKDKACSLNLKEPGEIPNLRREVATLETAKKSAEEKAQSTSKAYWAAWDLFINACDEGGMCLLPNFVKMYDNPENFRKQLAKHRDVVIDEVLRFA